MNESSRVLINSNTVLLTIGLALSGWTLKTVSEIRESQSALKEQVKSLERVVYSTGRD